MMKYDVCIIGGGVLGCLTALKLSEYPLSCLLIEKKEDFCLEISKANSAVLYPGYDHKPGTLKSRFTIEGNRRTAELCEELGVPVHRCGSLMAAGGKAAEKILQKKYRQGQESGIRGLLMLDREEALALEPCLSPEISAALFSPDTGVVYPWRLGMAAAEKAEKNGVQFRRRTKVCGIRRTIETGFGIMKPDPGDSKETGTVSGVKKENEQAGYVLTLEDGEEIFSSFVVNAAGVYAHQTRELLFAPEIRIRPTMADYLVYGREENPGLSHVIFYEPEDGKKGITLVPNGNGTILAGATERQISAGAFPPVEPGHPTEREGLHFLRRRAAEVFPALSNAVPIRTFAGLRPNPYEVVPDGTGGFSDTGRSIKSFVIKKEAPDGSFISLLGIKTPGITASVPIAEYVAGIILDACRERKTTVPVSSAAAATAQAPVPSEERTPAGEVRKLSFSEERTPAGEVRKLSFSEKRTLAETDPSYGKVICRCEQVTEAEVLEAIRCGAGSAEGIKLRCGAGMGRCQGARCRGSVESILEREKAGQKRDKNREADSPKAVQAEKKENPQELMCDYLLIGAGVAGLALAAELYRADPAAEILLVDREPVPGGVLVQCLHEGFPDGTLGRMLDGPGYLDLLWREVQRGVQAGKIRCLFNTHVTDLQERDQSGGMRSPAEPEQDAGQQKENDHYPVMAEAASAGHWIRIRAGYGILTCGAIERTAGMLMIPGTRPKGVYTAGEIQRMLNLENRLPGKKAVLVGTGNMGLIMADLMLRKGMEVVCILEKEDHVTASAGNIRKYLTDPGTLIPKDRILLRSEIGRIHGSPYLQGVTVRKADHAREPFKQEAALPEAEEKNTDYYSCDTLVIAAGLVPDRQLLHRTCSQKNCGHADREENRSERTAAENDVNREEKRILLFGNCEHIYAMVSAIRFEAGKMAEKMIEYGSSISINKHKGSSISIKVNQ